MAEKLTEKRVRDLRPGESGKWLAVYDSAQTGFVLRVSPKGAKTFWAVYRDASGRKRWKRLGEWGTKSVEEARQAAKAVRSAVDAGGDPARERDLAKGVPTLVEFWEVYLAEMGPRWRPKTLELRLGLWEAIRADFGDARLDMVTRREVEAWHARLTKGHASPRARGAAGKRRGGPVMANNALSLLRGIWNEALRREVVQGENPARMVRRNPERPRERFLSPDEARRLLAAIAAEEALGGRGAVERVGEAVPGVRGGKGKREAESRGVTRQAAGLFRLLMLTGARLSEVRLARWSWVDWKGAALRVPAETAKAGRHRTVFLSAAALEELRGLWEARTQGEWIIEGKEPGKPLAPPQKAWRRVRDRADAELNAEREEAGLPALDPGPFASVRLHDLRHSFASFAAAEGIGLGFIGKALGHSQVATTARYAHLADDPARVVAETVGDAIARAVGGARVLDAAPARPAEDAPEGEDSTGHGSRSGAGG